jgi:predicted site-specific integrase-resolvase
MHVSIGELALFLGVAVVTLRRWGRSGRLQPAFLTPGGHRRYDLEGVKMVLGLPTKQKKERMTIGYARVSGNGQKDDLKRQEERLAAYLSGNIGSEVISDLGSGINFKKKGLCRLIDLVISGQVSSIVLTHKDRLVRFGYELIERLCLRYGTKIVILDSEVHSFESELAQDVITIITVFSAKLYGSRSHQNKIKKLNPGEVFADKVA